MSNIDSRKAMRMAGGRVAVGNGPQRIVVTGASSNTVGPAKRSREVGCDLERSQTWLSPRAATTLGTVFHELTTNAAKFGSFSAENGIVETAWKIRQNSRVEQATHVDWQEWSGPPATSNVTEEFGTGCVRRSVGQELSGRVVLQLWPEGACCEVYFPMPGDAE